MYKIGYAQEIFTPPTGVDLAGYFNLRLNEGMYDDLMVKCVAFELNGKKLVKKAGYILTSASKFDLTIRYCIENKIYDLYKVNELLLQQGLDEI